MNVVRRQREAASPRHCIQAAAKEALLEHGAHVPCRSQFAIGHLRDRVRPGIIFALYLVLAGAERFLVEFIRRNTEAFAGLTAAQLWSLGMIVGGLVWIAVVARRDGLGARTAMAS